MSRAKRIIYSALGIFVMLLFVFFLPAKGQSQTVAYHTSTDSVINDLTTIANTNPSIVKIVPLDPKTIGGKSVTAFKISKDAAADKNKNRLVFVGTQHAREWSTTEVAFYLAKYLIEGYSTDPKIKSYIDHEEIWVIPVFNPDGYDYSKTKYNMQRKNRRDNGASCNQTDDGWGVDLNRNFGNSGSTSCTAEDYKGPSIFSEAEPQALKALMDKYPFQSLLTYHSYDSKVYYGGSGVNKTIAEAYAGLVGFTPSAISDAGEMEVWAAAAYNIPSILIELDQSDGFQPPATRIIPQYQKQQPAALYLIDLFNLNITTPTQAAPASVTAGGTFNLTVNGVWRGKTNADFKIKIGGSDATVTTAAQLPEVSGTTAQFAYNLTVQAPQGISGTCDLQVIVGDAVDAETSAVSFGAGACSAGGSATPTSVTTPSSTTVPTGQSAISPTPNSGVPSQVCIGSCPTQSASLTSALTPALSVSPGTQSPKPSSNLNVTTNPILSLSSFPSASNSNRRNQTGLISAILTFLINLISILIKFFKGF